MDRTERFYKIDQMIHDRKLVPFVDLMAALEVSRATLKRDLEYMRNRLNAPIVWDREAGGYRFDTPHAEAGAQYELPVERRETHSGVKDLYWRVPQGFPSGPLEVEVLAWGERGAGPARSSNPADRSGWLKLGHVVD